MPGLSRSAPEHDVPRTRFEHVALSRPQPIWKNENKKQNNKLKKLTLLCVQ